MIATTFQDSEKYTAKEITELHYKNIIMITTTSKDGWQLLHATLPKK